VRVRICREPGFLKKLMECTYRVSYMYRISQFKDFWTCLKSLHDQRHRRATAFARFSNLLLDCAKQSQQRNKLLTLKLRDLAWESISSNNQNVMLSSTFRLGRLRRSANSRSIAVNISVNILHRL